MYTKVKGENVLRDKILPAAPAHGRIAKRIMHLLAPVLLFSLVLVGTAYGSSAAYMQVMPELGQIKGVLSQVGPALSAVLFIVAGVFYAVGQMLPPEKKAQFHTTAINVIIGAVVIGVLSFASTSLATASTHLLSNVTANNTIG